MPKHQKETTYSKQDDGSIKIQTDSYYEQLAHQVVEIEKQLQSSFYTLKKDIDLALNHIIEDGSPKLVLTIEIKHGEPKITKRWITLKQSFNKR